MVDALVYGTGSLQVEVQVDAWFKLLVQVDYRLFGTGWCMVDALVYVDRLIYVEDCCLISVGAENVS